MKKIIYWFVWIIAVFSFLAAVYFVVSGRTSGRQAYLFGYKPYIIVGESMEPTIKKYGVIVVKQVDISEVQSGDIISFAVGNTDACHRVIAISEENGITTKGDNSKVADSEPVTSDNFNGKVIYFTNILADYLNFYQEKGVFIALILPVASLFLLILSIYWLSHNMRKNKLDKQSPDELD